VANGVQGAFVGDLFDAIPHSYRGQIDLIIANAPYVPSSSVADMPRESRDHEPRPTVDGGTDGMDLQRRILREAAEWLTPHGALVTETSTAQADALAEYARHLGWTCQRTEDSERGALALVVHH
jgi:release factor glutamine methyltransferase